MTSKYHKGLSKEQIELMEKLAHHEHARWSDWQKYVHSLCIKDDGGNLIIARSMRDHWERQIKIEYKDLSEVEKDSDREQVIRYWNLIK